MSFWPDDQFIISLSRTISEELFVFLLVFQGRKNQLKQLKFLQQLQERGVYDCSVN